MKTVGIMSMQRIINYGSFLQAYALKEMIRNETGSDVQFVDYNIEKEVFLQSNKRTILEKIRNNQTIVNYIKKKFFLHRLNYSLINNLKDIGVDEKNYNKNLDVLVIGSDEVFNCLQAYPVGYSRELFGYGFETIKVISYAASFGFTEISDLKNKLIDKEIADMLFNFSALSVRDYNSYSIINELTGMKPLIHVDPVLAYDFDFNYVINEHNYILLYFYTGRLKKVEESFIKKFAKKHHKKILSVGNYSAIADKNIICDPINVFSYFKNADYVITDTFHGTIFSIKTNSKFCTIIRKSNYNKLSYLLEEMGQSDRIVFNLEDIDYLFKQEIDYTNTNKKIAEESRRTREYLRLEIGHGYE